MDDFAKWEAELAESRSIAWLAIELAIAGFETNEQRREGQS